MIRDHHEERRKMLKQRKKLAVVHSSIVRNAGLEGKNRISMMVFASANKEKKPGQCNYDSKKCIVLTLVEQSHS
jgi:hypothetical protein